MRSQTNSNRLARIMNYSRQNQRTAAVFAFVMIVALGGAGIGVNKYFQGKKVKNATVTYEVQTGEYGTLPAWWFDEYFGSSVCQIEDCKYNSDPDKDKLTNGQEFYYKSDPMDPDTNNNDKNDGEDVAANIDPSRPGNVTFDEVASDDNIVGEGLAFEEDIQKALNEDMDISKVQLEAIPDGILEIVYQESDEIYTSYGDTLKRTITSHFPESSMGQVTSALETGSDIQAMEIASRALRLSVDLKRMPVPAKFLTFHKYNIMFYQTLYELMSLNGSATDMANPEGDVWFDKAQSLYALMQKLDFEKQRLLIR